MTYNEATATDQQASAENLQHLAQRTAYLVGPKFFSELVQALAETLDVSCVFIAECFGDRPSKASTLAFYVAPMLRPNFEYPLTNTPCEVVFSKGRAFYSNGVQSHFPSDQDLVDLDAESYSGMTLEDGQGNIVGHLCVIDQAPLDQAIWEHSLIELIRCRCGAEIERLKAQRQLHEEKHLYESILNGAHDCIFLKDHRGDFKFMNRNGALLNVEPEAALGKNNGQLFAPHLVELFDSMDRRVFKGEVVAREFELAADQGWTRICHATESPLFDDGGFVSGIVGVVRDISERRQAERLLESSERLASLGTIAAGIAHEINNPLTAIQLSAELALVKATHGQYDCRPELDAVLESTQAAAQIVREVLRSSTDQPIPRVRCNLREIVVRAMGQVRNQADAVGISLDLIGEDDLFVDVSPLQMQQVLVNLIQNGIQATGEKRTPVEISIRHEAGTHIVSVHDYGCGVAAADAGHIFDPFFTTRRTSGGTGLGLSVSRGIVAAHGGRLELGAAKQGATFLVQLPEAS